MNSSYRWYNPIFEVYIYWHDAFFLTLFILGVLIIVVYKYLKLKDEYEKIYKQGYM